MAHRKRLRRVRDLERSLTLLRVFLLASALICGEAIKGNRAVAALVGTGADGEDSFERNDLGYQQLFEVYAPIDSGNRAIGAYEIYANPQALSRLIGSRRTMLWLAVGGVFLTLWAALALLVRGASSTLRRRTLRLAESNRLLEESALEAVESLNATVDAKDPYTAGHSQRAQRIAVALGGELGLDREQLDILRFAGLFHDIGKIGVPAEILTKPDRLTELEFEIVKRHPEDGARIVGRLHRLHAAVPAVLHHHERWGVPTARPGRWRTRPWRSSGTAARSSRPQWSTPSSRSWSAYPSCSAPIRWPTSSSPPDAVGSAHGRPDGARGLSPRVHPRALPRGQGPVQEALGRGGRA